MRIALITTAIASALMLAACNQPDTPQQNQERVAEARQEAQRDVAEARQEASRAEAEARRDVQQAEHEARDELRPVQAEAVREFAQARHDVAVAEAEAKHRVETEKCRVLEANARSACEEAADANLESAKAAAKSRLSQAHNSADRHEQ